MRSPKSGADFFLCSHNLSSKVKKIKDGRPDNGANNRADNVMGAAARQLVVLSHMVQHPQHGASSHRPALLR